MKKLLVPFLLLVLVDSCLGAVIYGTVYDDSLNPVKNAIVEVSSTPIQRTVARNGDYRFQLPPGTYTITTKQNGIVAKEEITIEQDGEYIIDLFLFLNFEEEDDLINELDNLSVNDEVVAVLEEDSQINISYPIYILIFFFAVAILIFLFKSKKPKIKLGMEDLKEETTDAKKYLDFIKSQQGRTTQKEIRKHFGMSEAKISLVLTELEHKDKIRKIKKGRANIIILKE